MMVRTEIAIDGAVYLLAQGQDLPDLRRRIETAARAGGKFVEFGVVGNREVSVLISSGTQAVFSAQTVQFDARDTGDLDEPFGGMFDF
jgi:hypothetical protein